MAKQTRIQRKLKEKHRAVKPRTVRPLDKPQADNHAARRVKRAAHEALLAAQAAEAADRLDAEKRAREIEDQRLAAKAKDAAELIAMGHALEPLPAE